MLSSVPDGAAAKHLPEEGPSGIDSVSSVSPEGRIPLGSLVLLAIRVRQTEGRPSGDPMFDFGHVAKRIWADGNDVQEGHAGGFEGGDAVSNVAFGADQREVFEK